MLERFYSPAPDLFPWISVGTRFHEISLGFCLPFAEEFWDLDPPSQLVVALE